MIVPFNVCRILASIILIILQNVLQQLTLTVHEIKVKP
jgi:hypothetical protein